MNPSTNNIICNTNVIGNLSYFGVPTRIVYHYFESNKKSQNWPTKSILFILVIIFLLIAIINSSLLNPGPNSFGKNGATGLSVLYQNVQGLIPFSQLSKKHPNVDNTKISELHAYIYDKKPDVIVLNETWLKNTILDDEILPSNLYKIFHCDRTEESHPPDVNDPHKFRRNGGGVLIAISYSLRVFSNNINLKCKAEMLAIEIILDDGSKIVISTCYRVGTLGTSNYNEIANVLQKFLRKKRLKKFILVGDLNLKNANWETNLSRHGVEQMFLDEFLRLGLIQCVSAPTHIKENILDIILTNTDNFISNIEIMSNHETCKSDHYALKFDIKLKI